MSASKDVIFTGGQYEWLREHLFQDDQKEQSAYAFVAPSRSGDRLRLLTHHIVPIHPEDYDQQSEIYLALKHEVAMELAQLAIESQWSLIEIHSHPFSEQNVAFSSTDTGYAMPRFRWFAEQVDSRDFYHVMMVFGHNSADAIMYEKASDSVTQIDNIIVLNRPLLRIVTESSQQQASEAISDRLSRQVQAFGMEGQQRIRNTRVGIVGLGGTGSAIVNQLALMGVRDFVLVDEDVVELTNLNRLYGAFREDVEQGLSKVDIARRSIEKVDDVQVTTIAQAFPSPDATQALKNVDVLFGCTDSHGSRLQLNEFSLQYMLPYIDTALGIFSDDAGAISDAGGEVRTVVPGEFCLNCLGAINIVQASQDLLPDDLREEYVSRGYIQGEDIPAPSIVFLNNTIASLAVGEFLNLLTGYKAPAHMLYYSLSKDSLRRIAASPDSSCVACTPEGRLARGDTESFFQKPGLVDDLSFPPPGS